MSGRVGRDRFRRDHHLSSSSSSSFPTSSHGKNPPSRHLWVGNLAQNVTKSALVDHFVRFGELENVAYPPGRSYAFVNFVREDDAMAAMDSLQGFSLAGMALRIEFAKADKSSAPPCDESYLQHRDELQQPNRGSTFSKRESRIRHASPDDAFYPDSSRRNDSKTDHPSEILWIGFPSFLKVDDTILRKAFSPFGEIEKITAFPGRTYAFVQFRNLASACRAKETLQGKLFGNPRVHICFARNDTAPSTGGGRRGVAPDAPLSPHFKHNRTESSDNFFPDLGNISRDQFSNMEYRDSEITSFSRKEPSYTSGNDAYGERFHDFEPDVGPPRGWQVYHRSPSRRDGTRSAQFREFSPQKAPRKNPFREDPWDSPEDVRVYNRAKKLKIESFPQDELPEYPLHNLEQGNHGFPRMHPDLPLSDETGPLPYERPPDHLVNFNQPVEERHDWRSSHDAFQSPPAFAANSLELKRTTLELHKPVTKKEWKWEGTIAKGGTPVCRARCFPVGRIMDIFLPEFLDCTARTGLDMLAKHYYQATSSWVVFFVAATDADMGYYNEFMHYLEEKQRAAVSKLDERHTLFLVPPSDFSEKVLKVPGKLSISGVVLRLEPTSPSVPAFPPANEAKDTNHLMYPSFDTTHKKSESLSGKPFHPLTMGKPGISSPSFQGNFSTPAPSLFPGYGHTSGSVSDHIENRQDFQPTHRASMVGPTWSPHPPQTRDSTSQGLPITQEYHQPVSGRGGPEPNMANYQSGYTSLSYSGGSKLSLPEQRLPQPLLGPSVSSSSVSTGEELRQSGVMAPPRHTVPEANQISTSYFHQIQQPMQAEVMQGVSHAAMAGNRGTQEVQSVGSGQDEGENDPQKRLQATLQLAAALLQQIQQGKGK